MFNTNIKNRRSLILYLTHSAIDFNSTIYQLIPTNEICYVVNHNNNLISNSSKSNISNK